MKTTKHTSGEWHVKNDTSVMDQNGNGICSTKIVWTNDADAQEIAEREAANAKLISSAPEMLETLEKVFVQFPRYGVKPGSQIYKTVYAAIQKATAMLALCFLLSSCASQHAWEKCVRASNYTDAELCECDMLHGRQFDPCSICQEK